MGEDAAEALELAVGAHGYLWKVFRAVPFLVGGRIAALAQGPRVRPLGLDLLISEGSIEAANRAMRMMNLVRWSERHQDWVGYESDIDGFGPRRWWMNTGFELRIEVVPDLGSALSVTVDGRELPVVALVSLIRDDPDIAELAVRLAAR